MSLPDPVPGLVIRYSFLWQVEAETGAEEGAKDRPCAIVMAVRRDDDELVVAVLPITHSPPEDPEAGLELPATVAAQAGLDADRQWVRVDEVNTFLWPGYDLRPIPGRQGAIAYGMLPRGIFAEVQNSLRALRAARKLKAVPRD